MISKVHNNKNNIVEKYNSNEFSKIKLEKSFFHSSKYGSQNFPLSMYNNSNNLINDILSKVNKKESNIIKNGYKKKHFLENARNKESLNNSKSFYNKPVSVIEKKNNYHNILLSSNNSKGLTKGKYIRMIKPQINIDDRFNTERPFETTRTLVNEGENLSRIISTNKSSYNLNIYNIEKYIKEDNNSLKNLNKYIEINKEKNKYINKLINDIQNKYKKENLIPKSKLSKKMNNNHQYHIIKSKPSFNDIKVEESELFYNKIKNKFPQLINSTSMDYIKGIGGNRKLNETNYIKTKLKDI